MRESQSAVLSLGLCSRLFESNDGEETTLRFIDQAVLVWRSATRITKTGCSDYPNPRTVVQQKFGLDKGGSNALYRYRSQSQSQGIPGRARIRYTPDSFARPYDPAELERVVVHSRSNMTVGEYLARMTRMISEPAPPGYHEAIHAD